MPALLGPMQRSCDIITISSILDRIHRGSNRHHGARLFCTPSLGLSRHILAEALEVALARELLLFDGLMMLIASTMCSALVPLSLSLWQLLRPHVELQEGLVCLRLQSSEHLTYGFPILVVGLHVVSTCCTHR